MDTFILFLIEKYGTGVLVFGIVIYLFTEGILDVATDLISHRIIKRIDKEPD